MKVVVVGGADSVWADVAASEVLFGLDWWDLSVACNDIGCHWRRRLDAWATLHTEKMHAWRAERQRKGYPGEAATYARPRGRRAKEPRAIDHVISHGYAGGSSGLLGVSVAQHLGGTKIVLCGIPMTRTPHFAESTVHKMKGKPWSTAQTHWRKWVQHAAKLDGLVKSMSGATRELLGAPTPEWLGETDG